jgi:hypothetical protein
MRPTMTTGGLSPRLLERLARGDYTVNELAVAEAIMRRSSMFVPPQLRPGSAGAGQDDTGAVLDRAQPGDG